MATMDMGQKEGGRGAVVLLSRGELGPCLTQCGLGRGLPLYQVASSCIQPFSHNRHGPKTGELCLFYGGGELGPHLTQRRHGQGLPPYQVVSRSIQLFGHNRHGPKIGGCAFFLVESWVPIEHNVAMAKVYLRTRWYLDPSSCLATIDMGQKLGAVPFFLVESWVPI